MLRLAPYVFVFFTTFHHTIAILVFWLVYGAWLEKAGLHKLSITWLQCPKTHPALFLNLWKEKRAKHCYSCDKDIVLMFFFFFFFCDITSHTTATMRSKVKFDFFLIRKKSNYSNIIALFGFSFVYINYDDFFSTIYKNGWQNLQVSACDAVK